MVDALRTAREWIVPSGTVIDLHPTSAPATVHVGQRLAGPIDPGGATARHQGATEAIMSAVRERLFTVEDIFEFEFSTHADSLEELDEYMIENFRESRIGQVTLARARELAGELGTSKVSLCERVAAARLRASR